MDGLYGNKDFIFMGVLLTAGRSVKPEDNLTLYHKYYGIIFCTFASHFPSQGYCQSGADWF